MTRFSNILTFILLFISVCASAQGHTIKGKITNGGDADVMAAFVMVKSVDGGRVFGYASPDAEGYYHIDYSCEDDRVVVVVQGMGIFDFAGGIFTVAQIGATSLPVGNV